MTRGRGWPGACKAFWKNRLAAAASRSAESQKSIVAPVESTARYRDRQFPPWQSRVGGGAQSERPRWPPSAAQTARAVFPHAAFTKTPYRVDAREGEVRVGFQRTLLDNGRALYSTAHPTAPESGGRRPWRRAPPPRTCR